MPTPRSDANCLRVRPLVNAMRTASRLNSSEGRVAMAYLLCAEYALKGAEQNRDRFRSACGPLQFADQLQEMCIGYSRSSKTQAMTKSQMVTSPSSKRKYSTSIN